MNKYIISTVKAAIPHILDTTHSFLDHPLCIYIDDIYFKGSFFHDDGSIDLKTFINTKRPIYIKFKNGNKLETPRGRYTINEEEYYKVIKEKIKPDFYQLYGKNCFDNGVEVVEPENISEYILCIEKNQLITTKFLNEIADNGILLTENKSLVSVEDSYVCKDCCVDIHSEYLKHLFRTHEINAKTIIMLHNYKKFHDIASKINNKEI